MREIMYDKNSALIAVIVYASIAVGIEVGHFLGRRMQGRVTEPSKAHVNAIQASLLGVLALLLGFTFSLALQRFSDRSEAVVAEANAIGTAYLRARLLPGTVQSEVKAALQRHADLRVRAGAVTLDDERDRRALLAKTNENLDSLWRIASRAAKEDPNPVTSGLFVQALNDLIDAYGTRDAALERHVPEVVLFLLYGTFILTGIVLGYGARVSGHRSSFATYILIGLVVVLAFVIVDLDRPRRGMIKVDQGSLHGLKTAIDLAQREENHEDVTQLPRPAVTGRQ
ncbi:MAG TPA: hypothetical protein VLS88_04245 [Polyangiales bacterium]|nr:hypothetical protein [Polyangiales bacterium]